MNTQAHGPQYFSAPNVKTENISLRDFLNVVFQRKKEILIFSGTIFLSVLLFTLITPEIFQSEAKVLIRVGRESLALDPSVDGPTVNLSQSRENEVNSELVIIKSRLLAEQVVDRITPGVFMTSGASESGSTAPPNFLRTTASFIKETLRKVANFFMKKEAQSSASLREAAISKMIGNLKVAVEQKSHVITLSFESQNPQFGQRVLNTFMDLFQDHHIKVHSAQAPPQFFQDQVDKLFLKLQEKENALEKFRADHNIASIGIQKDTLFGQISRIQSDIAELNSQIAASRANNASLKKGLQSRSREVELGRIVGRNSTTSNTIKGRLFDFRIKEAELSARYPDDHRELMEVREQIRLAESALSSDKQTDEVSTGIDPIYQAMQLTLETGRAQLQGELASQKALAEDFKNLKVELAALVKNELTEARLKRDVSLLEEEYLRYRQDVQRTNISRALDMGKVSNLSIIQPATMPLEPIKPKKALNIALGLIMSFFGGISLAFFIEYLDDSLKTNEDVEKRLGLPVLASVPYEESRQCM